MKPTHRFYFCCACLWMLFLFNTQCQAQETGNAVKKDTLKSTIVAPGYGFDEYLFYDEAGRLVKKIKHDQFESKHPIYKLDIPRAKDKNADSWFFEPFVKFSENGSKQEPLLDPREKVRVLKSLKKYGLHVKTPEKATIILGPHSDLRPIVSQPAKKFLIKIENASVLDAFAEETEDFSSNALLDCSYITIYDYMGELFNEVLIPDKRVGFASISDDGRYLLCVCEYNFVWDEGVSNTPEGVLVVDLQTKEMDYIVRKETKNHVTTTSLLFADQYFQMTFGNPWSGSEIHRLYINPAERAYYLKTFPRDRTRKANKRAESFSQFEGVREDLKEFKAFSY